MTTTTQPQKNLTDAEREMILDAIRTQFKPWIDAAVNESELPKIVDPWDGYPAVVWEDGSPFEWAFTDAGGDVDEEFGFQIPARPETPGFEFEPHSSIILTIYRTDR